jgi:hypothetical protein
MIDGLGRIWKKSAMAYFNMYPGTCLKGPRKSGTTGTSVRITGNKAEF